MSEEQNKAGVGFWTIALLVLLLVYALSFWPVCWIVGHGGAYGALAGITYYPLVFATVNLPESVRSTIFPHGGIAQEGMIEMGLSVGLLRIAP